MSPQALLERVWRGSRSSQDSTNYELVYPQADVAEVNPADVNVAVVDEGARGTVEDCGAPVYIPRCRVTTGYRATRGYWARLETEPGRCQ